MDVYYIAYNQDMTIGYVQARAIWARAFGYAASEIKEGFWGEDNGDKHVRTYTIKFPDSGFRIAALFSRPSNLRGRQGIIAIDETAFHGQLGESLKAALAVLIWGGKARVISAHGGDGNPFNTLIGDIRTRCQGGSIYRITFREAVSEGLFRCVCLHTGREQSEAPEQAWTASMYKFYGAGASGELDYIPANGGGAWLPQALIGSRTSADMLVLRLACKEGYGLLSDEVRFCETQDWFDEHLKSLLETLPASTRSFLRCDFGRSGDLSVDYPLLQEKNLIRRVSFILELHNMPFRQREQITQYLTDGLPDPLDAALDARGNGAYLAEYVMQRYGPGRVQQVTPTEGWYWGYMPPVKTALEDGNLVDLPKDEDTLDDLRVVRVVNGAPRVLEQHSKAKANGDRRHGDSAIALALAYFASHEINKEPVKASSCCRRQAARMLEGF